MRRYLLSTHCVAGQVPEPMSDEEMEQFQRRIGTLEQEMRSAGAWVFSGRLHDPETATVVRPSSGDVLITDGPFLESKEHIGGFYVIDAEDLDGALAWAARVTACIGVPIEVRPFAHTDGP